MTRPSMVEHLHNTLSFECLQPFLRKVIQLELYPEKLQNIKSYQLSLLLLPSFKVANNLIEKIKSEIIDINNTFKLSTGETLIDTKEAVKTCLEEYTKQMLSQIYCKAIYEPTEDTPIRENSKDTEEEG